MQKTTIEWTDYTWNPIKFREIKTGKVVWHCEKVSPGCANCYAETLAHRFARGGRFAAQDRDLYEPFLDPKELRAPFNMKEPAKIFGFDMTDLFGDWVPVEWLDDIYAIIALTPHLTYQLLTKRPERMADYCLQPRHKQRLDAALRILAPRNAPILVSRVPAWYAAQAEHLSTVFEEWPLPNVWAGASCEDQERFDQRMPELARVPAAIHFLSCEPLLGPIDTAPPHRRGTNVNLNDWLHNLDWIIAGAESGPGARPMHPAWVRQIRDQCATRTDMGRPWPLPFFFKQWGEWTPYKPVAGGDLGGEFRAGRVADVHPTGESPLEIFRRTGGRSTVPGTLYMKRIGKKAAGRILDGRTWDEYPEPAQ